MFYMFRNILIIVAGLILLFSLWWFIDDDTEIKKVESILAEIKSGKIYNLEIPVEDAKEIQSYFDYIKSLDKQYSHDIKVEKPDVNPNIVDIEIMITKNTKSEFKMEWASFYFEFKEVNGELEIIDVEFYSKNLNL